MNDVKGACGAPMRRLALVATLVAISLTSSARADDWAQPVVDLQRSLAALGVSLGGGVTGFGQGLAGGDGEHDVPFGGKADVLVGLDAVSITLGKFNMLDAAARTPLMGGGGETTFWNIGLAAPVSGVTPPYILGGIATINTAPATFTLMVYDPRTAQDPDVIAHPFSQGTTTSLSAKLPLTLFGLTGYQTLRGVYSTAEGFNFDDAPQLLLPSAAVQVAHEGLVDRAPGELELGQLLGQRQLGGADLIADRAGLLLRHLGAQQVAEDLLHGSLPLQPVAHDVVVGGAHAGELEFGHQRQQIMPLHDRPPG